MMDVISCHIMNEYSAKFYYLTNEFSCFLLSTIAFGFNIFFPILYFMNFFPDDQSLLHDICVDLFNLIFLGRCSSYNSGIILWLKEKTRHLVSLLW